jgi:hypothetical protein
MLGNISSTYGTFLYPKSDAPRTSFLAFSLPLPLPPPSFVLSPLSTTDLLPIPLTRPGYLLGSATMVGIAGLCGLLALAIRYVLAQQNKELDQAESVDTSSDNGETEEERKMNRRQGRSATGAFRYLL